LKELRVNSKTRLTVHQLLYYVELIKNQNYKLVFHSYEKGKLLFKMHTSS